MCTGESELGMAFAVSCGIVSLPERGLDVHVSPSLPHSGSKFATIRLLCLARLRVDSSRTSKLLKDTACKCSRSSCGSLALHYQSELM